MKDDPIILKITRVTKLSLNPGLQDLKKVVIEKEQRVMLEIAARKFIRKYSPENSRLFYTRLLETLEKGNFPFLPADFRGDLMTFYSDMFDCLNFCYDRDRIIDNERRAFNEDQCYELYGEILEVLQDGNFEQLQTAKQADMKRFYHDIFECVQQCYEAFNNHKVI